MASLKWKTRNPNPPWSSQSLQPSESKRVRWGTERQRWAKMIQKSKKKRMAWILPLITTWINIRQRKQKTRSKLPSLKWRKCSSRIELARKTLTWSSGKCTCHLSCSQAKKLNAPSRPCRMHLLSSIAIWSWLTLTCVKCFSSIRT